MGRSIRLVCTLVLAAVAAWVPIGAGSVAHAAGTGDIVGTVLASSGYPASGAAVEVLPIGGDTVLRSVRAAGDGSFRVAALPVGSYRLRSTEGDSATAFYGWDAGQPDGEPIVVGENVDTRLARPFALPRLSSLTGRALDQRGQPAVGFTVCARPVVDGVMGASCVGQAGAEPDGSGSYRVERLPPGSYRLLLGGYRYLERWFGGHEAAADSPVLTVGLADDASLPDTTMVLGATLTGRVLHPDGSHAYGARVEAHVRTADGGWVKHGEARINDVTGDFTLIGLPTGQVRIKAVSWQSGLDLLPTWWPSADEADATSIDVVEGATTSVGDLTFLQGGAISGRVVDRSRTGIDRVARVTARRLDLATGAWVDEAHNTSDTGGRYVFRSLPPGTYRVRATAPGFDPGQHTAADGSDRVEVVRAAESTGVDVVLARQGRVEGRALSPTGDRLPGVDVTLWTRGADDWAPTSLRSVTDGDGNYSFPAVPAGDYRVHFSADGGLREGWHGAGADDVESAATVTVTSESTAFDVNAVVHGALWVSWSAVDTAGQPVAGAILEVLGEQPDGRWIMVGRTESLEPLALPGPGRYKMRLSAPYHRTTWYGGVDEASATVVSARSGEVVHVDGVLAALGTMTGRVVDDNGERLDSTVGYSVQVFVDDPASGGWVMERVVSASPDEETFLLRGIDDRDHKLLIQPFKRWSGAADYPARWIGGGDDLASARVFRGDSSSQVALPTTTLSSGLVVTSTAPPSIEGEPHVGRPLTAATGGWSVTPDAYDVVWRRGDVVVGTGASYKPTAADLGRALTVTVTARKAFHRWGVATSAPVEVVAAPRLATAVRAEATSPRADRALVTGRVTASGVVPSGRVTVSLGRQVLGRVALRSGRFGLAVRAATGRRTFTVRYLGNDRHLASSTRVTVRVR